MSILKVASADDGAVLQAQSPDLADDAATLISYSSSLVGSLDDRTHASSSNDSDHATMVINASNPTQMSTTTSSPTVRDAGNQDNSQHPGLPNLASLSSIEHGNTLVGNEDWDDALGQRSAGQRLGKGSFGVVSPSSQL